MGLVLFFVVASSFTCGHMVTRSGWLWFFFCLQWPR